MKTVLAFGTFDLLHPGHLSYLTQAKKLGEKLIVVVATDSNVEKGKGKKPINSEEHRRELVEALSIVDEAIVGSENNYFECIEQIKPSIIALGYDQPANEKEIETKLKEKGIQTKIIKLKAYKPEVYKSSKIKEKVKNDFI